MSIIRDITERKIAEEERRQLEEKSLHAKKLESLNVMACGIAHDFNNLLMAVLGNADLALSDLKPEDHLYTLIKEMEEAARKAADLSGQMLAYSGHSHAQTSETLLPTLVETMKPALRALAPEAVRILYHFEEDLPPINADPEQIEQMIMDLTTNAAEALEETKGVISISGRTVELSRKELSETYVDDNLPAGVYIRLEIADSGCGMDEDTLPKIFDPFYTTKFTGRGLGLASALGVIRSHSGAITIHSSAGRGTICVIYFPAILTPDHKTDLEPMDTSREWEAASESQKPIILLVDDELTVRAVTSRMLEKAGKAVVAAEDGIRALEIFRRHAEEFSAVILDLTMPKMDGEQTFRELRKIRADIPILLSSGYTEKDVIKRFKENELDGFIKKPYRAAALLEKLDEIARLR